MFISPMLLDESSVPPEDYANVITELKLDGIRLIYSNLSGIPRLYTKEKKDVTALFPEITNIDLPSGTVLDGEVISANGDNKPDYDRLMKRYMSNQVLREIPVQYVAFDIMFYNGKQITTFPLIKRKSILSQVIPTDTISIVTSQWIEGNSKSYFQVIKDYGLEGIVVKNPRSKYKIGKRSTDWLKIINENYRRSEGFCKKPVWNIQWKTRKDREKLYEMYRKMMRN
ncbi:DNA ligase [Halalkalibacter wakoensis JCM 9140]|uniref:DNA ligase n=1 Tax=Halalkalibacter wakoensis JCM 9140 TaxID=1236970 RepID=W4PZ29_9BACI|nr:hypothetical protein [Halalkalibacter wakoensis]GAE24982.1 DNA ligase [Halalkalibacter wakoensis JCM 9140]